MRLGLGGMRITVACFATVLLAACGSSSSKSSSPAPTASTSAVSPTASTSVASPTTSAPAAAKTTAATGNFDSCSVVTQAEAASTIGAAVTPGILGSATVEGGLVCVFYGPSALTPRNPNVAQTDSVRVVVVKGPQAVTWYNDYKSKVKAQPIAGYGDQAYYDGYASLSVIKGDNYLRIAVSPAGAAPSLSDERQLTTAVLLKL